MATPAGPPDGPGAFWQWWAVAGMAILGASFWWFTRFVSAPLALPPTGYWQMIDGLWRFSLLILTPLMILCWLAAAPLKARAGTRFYWMLQGWIAGIWAISVGAVVLAVGL